QAKEGDTVKLHAVLENVSKKEQGMTVAIIGLPSGLALAGDGIQLKSQTQRAGDASPAGKISAWELRGRDLVLYWRTIDANAKIDLNFDLQCRLPGAFRGPPSRAYLYYDAERKFWTEPLAIRIAERQ